MSEMRVVYLKNRKLDTKFREMFNACVYQFPALDDAWVYEADDRENEFYFPEGTTETDVEALVFRSVKERKNYVYKAVKNAEPPEAVKEHLAMIARGCVF